MSYREAHIACHRAARTGRRRSRSPATRCATTSPARSCPGSPPKAGSSTRRGATGTRCSPRVPWWGQTPEARQVVYEALLEAARRAAQRANPSPRRRLRQRAGGHGPPQELQGPAGGGPGDGAGPTGRDRRTAGPERGGKDHDVLPYYGADPAGRRPGPARRARSHPGADVPAGAGRDRVPRPGALDLSQNDGRGKYSGDPGDPRPRPEPSGTSGSTGCWTSCPSSTSAAARRTP